MQPHGRDTFAWLAVALTACATAASPGTRPTDMSRVRHEEAANREELTASEHAAQFNPSENGGVCFTLITHQPVPCWRSTTNPTEEHLEDAWAHRRVAAEHRAASKALRDAEARACAGIADEERDMSPFTHRDDIARVEALPQSSLTRAAKGAGVSITFRPTPGLTVERLRKVVDCHLARNAALGYEAARTTSCPLALEGIHAEVVRSREGGVSVIVRSEDQTIGKQIFDRAKALVAP